jgi:hypothetical protein
MVLEQDHDLEVIDMPINMGPQHPSTHGVFRMVLVINGEQVVDVTPHVGYMHRGGEKLMEAMDYRQGIGYADRTEYLAQFSAELGYCLAIERLMGVEIPERADYIRVILTELNRLSHFKFAGPASTGVRDESPRVPSASICRSPKSDGRPPDVRVLPRRRAGVGRAGQLRPARARDPREDAEGDPRP